jgi:acetyl esterase/lipase
MHHTLSSARGAVKWSWLALFLCLRPSSADGQQPTSAAPPVPPGVKLCRDLTFCDANNCNLKVNVAHPTEGKGPFPAVVLIHGGGWACGSHREYTQLALRLAAKGYVAATVTYRFVPEHCFPAQVHDVKCAVRWLRAHAAEYKVDKERIGVFGHSAGGHLACMLGTTSGQKDLEGNLGFNNESSDVCCVVCCSGLTDLAHAYQFCTSLWTLPTKDVVKKFVGAPLDKAADSYAKASPITYAAKTSPPTLLIYGTKDSVVPIAQSQRLGEKLRQAGATVEVLPVKDALHDFNGELARRTEAAMVEFFERHLKRPAAPR